MRTWAGLREVKAEVGAASEETQEPVFRNCADSVSCLNVPTASKSAKARRSSCDLAAALRLEDDSRSA